MALGIGSVISFAAMMMAAQAGELAARQLHATELLMLLGTAIVMLVERPVRQGAEEKATDKTAESFNAETSVSALEQPQLLNHG